MNSAHSPSKAPATKRRRQQSVAEHGFAALVASIRSVHEQSELQAVKAVNLSLTWRNWLIGAHIHHYELHGADRATYGDRLLDTLALQLQRTGLKRVDARELRRFRQFYLAYPQIRETLSPVWLADVPASDMLPISGLNAAGMKQIRETATPELPVLEGSIARQLVERLSFSHFAELTQMDDPLKRRFYEVEALRGNWSVRELKRQIGTQYFERSALSTNKAALARLTHTQSAAKIDMQTRPQVIRDPYVFEFLGLKPHEVMSESHLEDALLGRLQAFLLELGHGFCFEARQKRLLIGGEHFFVDLVFYHRVLKCHVLIELKNAAFQHEHLGQLNAYVSYYRKHEMSEGDQPPIGILLCSAKNYELVEFALAGMANQLFVSRYQVQLPGKEEIAEFLRGAVQELEGGGGR